MDQGIRAVWYDLGEDDKDGYLDWLHSTYLPAVLQRPGIMWAAHYEITGGGANMDKIGDVLERAAPRRGMKTWLYAATTIPPTRPLPSKKGWMVSKSVYHSTSESTFRTLGR